MAAKITYYAIVNEFSSRERPGGVIRRIVDHDGRDDQAFTRNLKWEHTGTLYSYERGDGDNKLHEISEEEANQIVERIRRTVEDVLGTSPAGTIIPPPAGTIIVCRWGRYPTRRTHDRIYGPICLKLRFRHKTSCASLGRPL